MKFRLASWVHKKATGAGARAAPLESVGRDVLLGGPRAILGEQLADPLRDGGLRPERVDARLAALLMLTLRERGGGYDHLPHPARPLLALRAVEAGLGHHLI